MEGAQDLLTMLCSGAGESMASPEMTTKQKKNLFEMVAEEGVAEINRLVPRLEEAVEMSRLRPSRSNTIFGLLLAVRSNLLVPQFMEGIIGVSAGGYRSTIWSA